MNKKHNVLVVTAFLMLALILSILIYASFNILIQPNIGVFEYVSVTIALTFFVCHGYIALIRIQQLTQHDSQYKKKLIVLCKDENKQFESSGGIRITRGIFWTLRKPLCANELSDEQMHDVVESVEYILRNRFKWLDYDINKFDKRYLVGEYEQEEWFMFFNEYRMAILTAGLQHGMRLVKDIPDKELEAIRAALRGEIEHMDEMEVYVLN